MHNTGNCTGHGARILSLGARASVPGAICSAIAPNSHPCTACGPVHEEVHLQPIYQLAIDEMSQSVHFIHMPITCHYYTIKLTILLQPYTVKSAVYRNTSGEQYFTVSMVTHTVTTETVKYCSPGVFSYTALFTVYVYSYIVVADCS